MKKTLITGGAKRLGAEICLELAQNGYFVIIHYRSSYSEACETRDMCLRLGGKAEIIQGDFSTIESTSRFIDDYLSRFLTLDHLINNAGDYLIKPAHSTSIEQWNDLFSSNFFSPLHLSQRFLPEIIKNKGSILNLGMAGLNSLRINGNCPAYMIAKGALLMLTKSLAREMAPHQVRVNMISPGYLENSIDLPESLDSLPFKRAGSLKEVARLASFLIHPHYSYITGQNIEVAGGVAL